MSLEIVGLIILTQDDTKQRIIDVIANKMDGPMPQNNNNHCYK